MLIRRRWRCCSSRRRNEWTRYDCIAQSVVIHHVIRNSFFSRLCVSQLDHIITLDDQIKTEMQEIEKQTIGLKKGIEKYTDFDEMQDSANATKSACMI